MKVFVTGHRGYIGSHLVSVLKNHGDYVAGCDLNLFEGCEWGPLVKPDKEYFRDISTLSHLHFEGFDCVMHLAAFSNDPMGELDLQATNRINRDASIHLARTAKKAGVPLFLFASSCSIYGKNDQTDMEETSPLNPQSAYARTKIEAEREIAQIADEHFSPVFLRNSTAYGDSPMLRLDLMVNNLMAYAFTTGDIQIKSDGSPWRPLIHAKDIANAFVALLHAPRQTIHNQAINIGANQENYQVWEVARKVTHLFPKARLVFTGEVGADPRNYRVNFDKLYRLLPDFKLEYSLDSGMQELHRSFVANKLTRQAFEEGKYSRLVILKKRMPLIFCRDH
jgi:nucleoside-diphosphate-sugar epimerase